MEPTTVETSPQTPVSVTDRQWAIWLHLSGLLGFFTPHLANIIGPLVIWLIKKPDSAFLDSVGKRVLNFQISYSLYGFISGSLSVGLFWTVIFWIPFGLVWLVFATMWLIFTILGAIKESNGEAYTPPLVIKFFS
ncbi:DUF4870 domain-containing protein [soil metagenome]